MKRLAAITLFALAIGVNSPAHSAARECSADAVHISRFTLVEILQRDGFSFELKVQDEFKRFGEISVGKSCFVIFLFTTEFRSAPGTNPHFAAYLLVLRNFKYIGKYQLDNENMPTRIRGNRVEFPGLTKDRNFVPFSEAGPPREVWLNGEIRKFTK